MINMIKKLLCRWFGWFCPPIPPIPPVPPEPPIPPTEWVKVWICEDTQLLSRPDCRHGIHTEFEKGKEPTITCKMDHNPIPPQPVYPKFEKYTLHMVDMFAYAYNHPNWDIEPWIDRIAQTGASALQLFGWAGFPGQAYDLEAMPWKWIWIDKDGNEVSADSIFRVEYLVDFNQKNPLFEATYKKIAKACHDKDRSYRHTLFMSRYNFHIFTYPLNRQRIREFYSPEGLEVQKDHVADVLRWSEEIGIEPDVLLMNEPAHYGNDEEAHKIADWHRIIGDMCLEKTSVKKVRFDSSHSEYPHSEFVGDLNSDGTVHRCPKPECGYKEMGRAKWAGRPFQVEAHGCSTKAGFIESGIEHALTSEWKHFTGNEDGGSPDGRVIAYNPNGSVAFRFADKEQYREALEYCKQLEIETGKDIYITGFPTGMLKLGEGDFSNINCIDWEKYNVYKEIHNG